MPELSDAEVFGKVELSDSDVFGSAGLPAPSPESQLSYAMQQGAADTVSRLPYRAPVPQQPGRITQMPGDVGEWANFLIGGMLHPIRQAETAVESAAHAMGVPESYRLMVRPSELMEQPIKAIPTIPQQQGGLAQAGAGLVNTAAGIANFLQTPEGVATTLFPPLRAALGAQMLYAAPEQLIQSGEAFGQGNVQTGVEQGVGGLLGLGGGRALVAPAVETLRGQPSYQVPEPTLPFETPRGLPLPERASPNAPFQTRFAVDPLGKIVDVSQLTERELAELYRGPKEYVPRETYVRPAQAEPALVGQELAGRIRQIVLEEPQQPLYAAPETAPKVEPLGGQISFASPAAAKAIPSARQSAVEVLEDPAIKQFLAEEAQAGRPVNISPSYRRPKPAPSQAEFERRQRRENVEKGLYAEQPPMEPLPPEVGQYPAEPSGTGVLSNLQRSRLRVALEEGKPIEYIRNVLRTPREYASPIRGNQAEVQVEGLQRERGAETRGSDIQRPREGEGTAPSGAELPQEGQIGGQLYMAPGMLFDPKFYKDTAKQAKQLGAKVAEQLGKAKEYFKGAEDFELTGLKFDTKTPLPDFQENKRVFAQPFGTEKLPVIGRMMGGKGRIRTDQDRASANFIGESKGVGPAVASNIGEIVRGRLDSVFKPDKEANLAVEPTKPGQSLKISDVVEGLLADPNSYKLTPVQRSTFNELIRPLMTRIGELAKKYGVIEEEGPYFTRIVTEHPKEENVGGRGGPLSTPSVGKERAFPTEQAGWAAEYKYAPSLEQRLVLGVERLYRAIAIERFLSDPALESRSPKQVRNQLIEQYKAELASGEMTMERIDRMVQGVQARGTVNQPRMFGRIFDPTVARALNREFHAEQSNLRKNIATVNSIDKAIELGLDLGVTQIQLLPTLARVAIGDPTWFKAAGRSLQAMGGPQFFANYARQPENQVAIRQLAQVGSSIGRLQEFQVGLDLLGKVRFLGEIPKAFARQFQTALDVAKIERWKALSKKAPESEWPRLVRGLEATLLSSRMESAMVTSRRALLERILLMAPSYYRGAVESIAALAEKGTTGKEVQKTMGALLLGGLATYFAGGKIVGMDVKELYARLDPRRPDFMMWTFTYNGKKYNVGVGGIYRSLLRLAGKVVQTSQRNVRDFASLSTEKNPLAWWYRGHSGPAISKGWEALTERDFLGEKSDVLEVGKGIVPMTAKGYLRGEKPTPIESALTFAGVNVYPESFSTRMKREADIIAKEKYQQPYEELSFGQRGSVARELDRRFAGESHGMSPERERELAERKEQERNKRLTEALPADIQKWVKDNKLRLSGYKATAELGGSNVRLTEQEQELLFERMSIEYEDQLRKLMQDPAFAEKETYQKQDKLQIKLEVAREKAWNAVIKQMKKEPKSR